MAPHVSPRTTTGQNAVTPYLAIPFLCVPRPATAGQGQQDKTLKRWIQQSVVAPLLGSEARPCRIPVI